ncbi:MAG: hypothetical protein J6S91_09120 [Treponema sp.]|nr:hypothetical protein [Treponema sp.]
MDKPEASGDGWTITMTPEGKKPVTTTWIMEQGRWKLSEFSTIQSKGTSIWSRSGHEGFDVADPFMIDIKGALLIPIGGASKVGFQLGADFHPNDFLYMSVGFLSETVMMRSSSYPYPLIPTKRNTIYTGAGLQIPLVINNFVVIPHGDAQIGFSNFTNLDESGFMYGFGGGVKVGYIVNSICPMVGLDYMHSIYKQDHFANEGNYSADSLRLSLGIKVLM